MPDMKQIPLEARQQPKEMIITDIELTRNLKPVNSPIPCPTCTSVAREVADNYKDGTEGTKSCDLISLCLTCSGLSCM
jgi:hypothetical protein